MFTAPLAGAWIHLRRSALILMNNDLSQICTIHTFAACHAIHNGGPSVNIFQVSYDPVEIELI